MTDSLEIIGRKMEALAIDQGLDYFPVHFEQVPASFMMEVSIYGLPVRMPHWSFGVRYVHQLIQHQMGHSRLFEVVYPGNPGRAFLAENNSIAENTLVIAHVLGHADFSKNNELFRRSQEEVGYKIVEQAAAHAMRISAAIEQHGPEKVEQVLDAALALEAHIDVYKGLRRERYPEYVPNAVEAHQNGFHKRFNELPGEEQPVARDAQLIRAEIPPHLERDLLWFIAQYAPDLEDWERDIFLAVREESFYFYPVFACQTINEGWASYWHARLLREADFIPQSDYLDAIKTHSDVVRPHASGDQVSLSLNPYHLGFSMWEKIIETKGLDAAFQIRKEEDDFGFIRNYLTDELAEELNLFQYKKEKSGAISVLDMNLDDLKESILERKYNFGAPRVSATDVGVDGTLHLTHEHGSDGRGLDLGRCEKVLEYTHKVWRRPVTLSTVDARSAPTTVSYPAQ